MASFLRNGETIHVPARRGLDPGDAVLSVPADHGSPDGTNAALCPVHAGRCLRRVGDVDACASFAACRDRIDALMRHDTGSDGLPAQASSRGIWLWQIAAMR